MEATPGLEPGIKVLQTSALPLGYVALLFTKNPAQYLLVFFVIYIGDPERARTVDLQRDRLAF